MFNQKSKVVEEAITRAAVTKAALSEMERFSAFLDEDLGGSGQRADGADEVLPERQYVYVADDPLLDECSDEVKLLILGIRCLSRQQRYEEALSLANDATRLAPSYWRGWINRGTLLGLFGKVDDAEEIFGQVVKDFAGDPKAVAAGLHGRAWVNELRFDLAPPADVLRETTRLYERSLRLDDSRANTRACLVISRLMSGEVRRHEKILEDSVLREGFLENLRLELDERGAKMHEVLKAIPTWLRHLLYPIRPLNFGESNG